MKSNIQILSHRDNYRDSFRKYFISRKEITDKTKLSVKSILLNQKKMKYKNIIILLLSLIGLNSISQTNYFPAAGISPFTSNIGINMPALPTTYNLEVGGGIGMKYGDIFGVTASWPSKSRGRTESAAE